MVSGVVQESMTGSLTTSTLAVGNFQTFKLKTEVGQWQIKRVSTNSYSLKIVGEALMTLIQSYSFIFI